MQSDYRLPHTPTAQPVDVPALVASLPWMVQPSLPGDGAADTSNLAQRVSHPDRADAVPKWDLCIALQALLLLLWPIVPGDQPAGKQPCPAHLTCVLPDRVCRALHPQLLCDSSESLMSRVPCMLTAGQHTL